MYVLDYMETRQCSGLVRPDRSLTKHPQRFSQGIAALESSLHVRDASRQSYFVEVAQRPIYCISPIIGLSEAIAEGHLRQA